MAKMFTKDGALTQEARAIAGAVAGPLTATVSKNGVVQGTNEWLIALTAVRITNNILNIAEIAAADPSVLQGPISEAVAKVDAAVRAMAEKAAQPADEPAAEPAADSDGDSAPAGGGDDANPFAADDAA